MSKIVRMTYHRCDNEHLVKFYSKERYAMLLYNSIYQEPEECFNEVVDYFTADLVYQQSSDPDDVVAVEGGRFTKKGLKELREYIYTVHQELINEKPHQVTDGVSRLNTDLSSCDTVVDED